MKAISDDTERLAVKPFDDDTNAEIEKNVDELKALDADVATAYLRATTAFNAARAISNALNVADISASVKTTKPHIDAMKKLREFALNQLVLTKGYMIASAQPTNHADPSAFLNAKNIRPTSPMLISVPQALRPTSPNSLFVKVTPVHPDGHIAVAPSVNSREAEIEANKVAAAEAAKVAAPKATANPASKKKTKRPT